MSSNVRDPSRWAEGSVLLQRPRRAWNVRKRRKPNGLVLVRLSEVFIITPLEEQVWRLTDGSRSVAEISARCATGSTHSDELETLAQVVEAIEKLTANGLIDVAHEPRAEMDGEGFVWMGSERGYAGM